jgi:hypothetical protein
MEEALGGLRVRQVDLGPRLGNEAVPPNASDHSRDLQRFQRVTGAAR